MESITLAGRAAAFLLGLALVLITFRSVIITFVLPRGARSSITATVFILLRFVFDAYTGLLRSYKAKDAAMALYAPIGLLLLPLVWLVTIFAGYALMYWSLGVSPVFETLVLSGSSMLTLGFDAPKTLLVTFIAFSEAAIGLIVVALFISYLPTMYSAFSRRERDVTMLEVRAGTPPSSQTLLWRYYRIQGLERLGKLWETWEVWFADLEETHTSLAALSYFRSPQPDHSWITAAGTVLDSAALTLAAVDIPYDPQAALTIRAGYLALQRICDFFSIPYNALPKPDDPISISRMEFDEVYDFLAANGAPMKPDREQAWRDYRGWRVNYDVPLLSLALLLMAPPAAWVSDRYPAWRRRTLFRLR
ncbi:MAG: hypothetical protein U0822_12330 [Anaerolineae bacterium]